MTIGIVTDSTAYLTENEISEHEIKVVPVQVVIDGGAYPENSELTNVHIIEALRAKKSVTTSRPNSKTFSEVYQQLVDSGVTEILSIHISSKLSGTYESAVLASKSANVPVHVIDSHGVAGYLRFAVLGAAKLRQSGLPADEIKSAIFSQCLNTKMYFYVDTLEFLERGGRISAVKSKLGKLLTVKPILKIENGQVELLELVRTESKALSRLVELATAGGPDQKIAINHVAGYKRAELVAEAIADQLKLSPIYISEAGPVVATHVGPGAVAVVLA